MSTTYKIIYILGMTHSGSTLLDSLIGAHPEVFSIGEGFELDSYVHLRRQKSAKTKLGNQCTCGAPTVWDCAFWRRVDRNMQDQSGASLRDLRISSPDPVLFAKDNKILFDSVQNVSGARYIVDSSKVLWRFQRLAAAKFVEVVPIHLVRDPKAQIYSILKRTHSGVFRPALRYNLVTVRTARALNGQRHIKVAYEALVEKPEESLSRIMSEIGLAFNPRQLDWARAERHNLGGNAMRAASESKIVLDNSWKLGLNPVQLALISLITYPARHLTSWCRSNQWQGPPAAEVAPARQR